MRGTTDLGLGILSRCYLRQTRLKLARIRTDYKRKAARYFGSANGNASEVLTRSRALALAFELALSRTVPVSKISTRDLSRSKHFDSQRSLKTIPQDHPRAVRVALDMQRSVVSAPALAADRLPRDCLGPQHSWALSAASRALETLPPLGLFSSMPSGGRGPVMYPD